MYLNSKWITHHTTAIFYFWVISCYNAPLHDMENVSLLSKHAIIIASKKLSNRCTLHETIRVKSGAWDENEIFMYSTLTQQFGREVPIHTENVWKTALKINRSTILMVSGAFWSYKYPKKIYEIDE